MFYSELTGMPVYHTDEVCIRKETAVCVTGHRTKSIKPYRDNPENFGITCYAAKLMLDRYISIVMKKGYTTLLSGLAEGTDLWAAERVLFHKRYEKERRLIGVMPYMSHFNGFKANNIELLRLVERHADMLVTTCNNVNMTYGRKQTPLTDPTIYKKRNYYMVDNSAVVIAFYNESNPRSGTGQTVRYARQLGHLVLCFDNDDIHRLLDRAGLDKMAIYNELKKLKLNVPKP
ncbi:MAG: DUF1273 family protein [Ruminococcus sp.]|nr:DUF1273 family protein [Ruminococcus sp.]MBQ9139559.1 DUF1273 family protein [Ruminococcus sp.]